MEQPDWMARVGTGIAKEVRRHRLARGMSAQQLSDACAALGANIPRTVISNIENGRKTNVSVAEVLVLARALEQPPAALVFPAGYVSEVEYLPEKKTDPLRAIDWFSGEVMPPDAGVTLPREGKAAIRVSYPEGIDQHQRWAVNIARKHRAVVNRIRNHYRSAWESEMMERTAGEPDNHSAVAREVAKNLEYYLYDLREEMARLGLVVPELPSGMKVTKRPEENISYGDEGEIVGRWTQHGPPPF
ncbi:helix-turn-helix domain-containing protein [Streptomyces olivaceus]|uniref:helix-turn-helix domain-containing protein n=1 Tax=Streptomyces olivaceus TaxID=47716 RepID=UPI001CC9625C|nr:helix-turn-helix transcriptional regulator [Streptomyces olivaceus]MBZ6250355.1 helix-turn-helix domain-containing protein [Streptomyces olivaceus]